LGKTNASPVWPASGVAFAAVLWLGYRVWPGIALGACLANVEAFLRNQAGDPGTILAASAAISVGNTLEAVSGAWLLRRFPSDGLFGRAHDVFKFVTVALVMCVVSASIGSTTVSLVGLASSASYPAVWFTWWVGDATGVLVVTPVLLAWCRQPKIAWMPAQALEAALLFGGLVVAGQIGFGGWPLPKDAEYPLLFLLIPFLVWAAFRFGPREAATAGLVTAGIAVWNTVHGRGPFVGATVHGSLLLLQAFAGVVTATILAMAAVVAERGAVQATLRRAHDELDRRVTERTQELLRLTETLRAEIAERNRAEEAIRQSEASFRLLFANNPQPMWVYDLETLQFLEVNEATVAHYGYSRDEFLRMRITNIRPPEELPRLLEDLARERPDLQHAGPWKHRRRDGGIIDVEIASHTLEFSGRLAALVVAADITERREAEETLRTRDEHIRQLQKLEAVGQLAGGVAHDFNNLLTVITGRSQLLLDSPILAAPIRNNIEQIRKTAERAAALTRQLLAFSRKQILAPKVLSLNTVVPDLTAMLKRLIGEDIDLVFHSGSGLGRVKADPGQLEQVIMNLVVNARDAMPEGGRITVETANVELSELYARQHVGVQAGPYVMLAVSDTGIGMDPATQAKIFEPFFTTKASGKGTGLGLSTVYGIVKQSGGNVWVYSEPSNGTTFKIYLPRVEDPEQVAEPAPGRPGGGTETVLLVEDEDELRMLAREILEGYGYTIFEGGQPAEALLVAERHTGPIDLLVTDVVMPEMSGRALAERLRPLRPEMKVLYMSGYTDNAIVHHGRLDPGTPFIQKPFTPEALAQRVREVLDSVESA
jgi:hypothetical protein